MTAALRASLVVLVLGVLIVPGLSSSLPARTPGPELSGGHPAFERPVCVPRSDAAPGMPPACDPPAVAASTGPVNASNTIDWTELTDRGTGNISGAGVAADSSLGEAVQFGGFTLLNLTNATDLYDESQNRWTVLHFGPGYASEAVPSPRSGFAFAGDAPSGVAVLFGGETNTRTGFSVNDTWVFNFSTDAWTNVSGPSAPAPRENAAFAIDPSLGVGFLFGGWDPDYQGTGQVTYSDSWEFNLSSNRWSRVDAGEAGPPASYGGSMDWDQAAGTFDLFGGCYPCSSNVWQFDPPAGTWSEPLAIGGIPSARMLATWSYDPALSVDVLYGGTNGPATYGDTSIFTPASAFWTLVPQAIGPASRYAASADWLNVSGNETLLMTGGTSGIQGFNQTWRLAAPATLSVDVINLTSGLPISGALVSSGVESPRATGADGTALLSDVPSEEISLNVTASGYAGNSQNVWPPPGIATTVTVALAGVAQETIDVEVTYVGGPVVPGALVNVTAMGHALVPGEPTGPTGWANFTGIPACQCVVTAWALGSHTSSAVTDFAPGQVLIVRLTLVALATLEVRATAVLPNATVVPLGDATIDLVGALLGVTSTTGELNVTTMAVGPQTVNASAPYFRPNSTSVDIPTSGPVVVPLRLDSAIPGTAELTVLDAVDLLPIPAAQVNFTRLPPVTVTPATFSYTTTRGILLTPLLAGNYSLTAWSVGFEQNSTVPNQWVQPGQIDSLTVLLTPLPKSVLDTVVLDSGTHTPIAGASVTVVGVTTVLTDAGGWANFSALTAGTFELVATASGYDPNQTAVVLSVGQVVPRFPVNLTRAQGGSQPGGQNDLTILPPTTVTVWPLLLLPFAALALALVYLTILRAPEPPPPPPAAGPEPGRGASPKKGFWQRLRPGWPGGGNP